MVFLQPVSDSLQAYSDPAICTQRYSLYQNYKVFVNAMINILAYIYISACTKTMKRVQRAPIV